MPALFKAVAVLPSRVLYLLRVRLQFPAVDPAVTS